MNATSASGVMSASSSTRNETAHLYSQRPSASINLASPLKKKRSLPGNPDPEAEVIALSPKTLLATNRFICEICNKGFQRDQNLQLHRRGHNLPWKLKQRTNEDVRKKVYVCPELTCVHHDPSRALGDLTGIKKHFCRKHGEKKWKCDKCSKRYAVQSDWKAHSKICGTREYRCDCGNLFSRRDSFITHRAFCDALAQESARGITATNSLLSPQTQIHSHGIQALPVKREQELNLAPGTQPWLACPPSARSGPLPLHLSSPLFSTNFGQPLVRHENPSANSNPDSTLIPFQPPASPHMSATALLQKAAQMGVTMSKPTPSPATLRPGHHELTSDPAGFSSTSVASSTAVSGLGLSLREEMESGSHALASFRNKAAVTSGFIGQATVANSGVPSRLHDMIRSLPSSTGFEGSSFEENYHRMMNPKREGKFQDVLSKAMESPFCVSNEGGGASNRGGNDGLTRDFLGIGAFSHKDFLNMAGFDYMNSSSPYGRHNQNQPPWEG